MRLKGTLLLLGAAAYLTLVKGDSKVTTLSTTTIDPDLLNFDWADLKMLTEIYDAAQSTTWKLGPGIDCNSTSDCSGHGGTQCFGMKGCAKCMCEPYEYAIYRSALSTIKARALSNTYYRRGFYVASTSANTNFKSCVKPKRIGDQCDHNDQCPKWDDALTEVRRCENNVCVCNTGYFAETDKLSCRKPGLNEDCTTVTCRSSGLKCDSTSKKCICDNALYYYEKGGATGSTADAGCRRGYWGQNCGSSNHGCDNSAGTHDNVRYLSCDSGTCKCTLGYYIVTATTPATGTPGSSACRKLELGQTGCTVNSVVRPGICYNGHSHSATRTTTCVSNKCVCRKEYPLKLTTQTCGQIGIGSTGCRLHANLPDTAITEGYVDTANDDARCKGGSTTVCAGANDDTCVCHHLYPKQSGTDECLDLPVGTTGCLAAVSGNGLVDTFVNTLGTEKNERCVSNSVCDGSGDGICKCPSLTPIKTSNSPVCEQVRIDSAGCRDNPTDAVTYTDSNVNRCYHSSYAMCDNNICKCKSGTPISNTDKTTCSQSGWKQTCAGSASACKTGLSCQGSSLCMCTGAVPYLEDTTKSETEKIGEAGNVACRRLNLDENGCSSAGDCIASYINSPSSKARCDGTTCKCSINYRQYGANRCDVEYDYGETCDLGTQSVDCDANMTCTGNKCACDGVSLTLPSLGAFTTASNTYDTTKKSCRHTESSYTVTEDQVCTHDLVADTITDVSFREHSDNDRWRLKKENSKVGGSTLDSAVKVCGTNNLVCSSCVTTSTESKKCLSFLFPINPNPPGGSGGGGGSDAARPVIIIWTLLMPLIVAVSFA